MSGRRTARAIDTERSETGPALPQALLDPTLYPHAAPAPQLIETHISWVVLAGEYAYKFKKPVRFPFLDYSTRALRRAACCTEVALNARWAPDLYLGVSELVASAAGWRLDVAGTALEPAVRMRRFDRREELDALVVRAAVAPEELATLGSELAQWQAAAPAVATDSTLGRPAAALGAAEENLATLRASAATAQHPRLAQLVAWVNATHAALEPTLAARRAAGRVRECHGDLHTRNVVRWRGRLTPFDGIDFDAGLRFIDAASDVAFLCMDLERLGRADLCHAFLDAWFAASGDYAAARPLPWFLCYRALVRAKVGALRAGQLTAGSPAAASAAGECADFLGLAAHYATRSPGRLVLTHGVSGSGKSWLAARLVTALPAIRLRADVERKRLAGLEPAAHTGSSPDAGLYSAAATQRTYQRLAVAASALVAGGFDTIVDATFLDAAERARFAALAHAAGAPLTILDCTAPRALLAARVVSRSGDPSEATLAVLERQLARPTALAERERRGAVTVDTAQSPDVSALAAQLKAAAVRPGDGPRGAAPVS